MEIDRNAVKTDVQTSIPAASLLELLTIAKENNQRFVRLGDRLIPVREAIKSKRLSDAYAYSALRHLEQSCAFQTGTSESVYARYHMENAAEHAGYYFCLFMRDLGFVDDPTKHLPMPDGISENGELQRKWEEGFAFARTQMYRDDS